MTIIRGYSIQSENGQYLAHDYVWLPHERIEESWVHPVKDIANILIDSKTWELKPTTLIPAVFSHSHGTRAVDDPIDIKGLRLREALDFIRIKGWGD